MISPTDYVLSRHTPEVQHLSAIVAGELKGRGYTPRDFTEHPPTMFSPPSEMPLVPEAEWSERIREQTAKKSRISDIRTWDALDQNGQGFCWFYSTTGVVMLLRSLMNQPHVRLSAHAGACKIKNFRNEGGWCGLSAQFYTEKGCPSVEFWPEKSMDRSHDTAETWANAALHKITEDWVDLSAPVYDRNLTFKQVASCLLTGTPCAVDFNWWGHSVAGMDLVDGQASFNAGLLRCPMSGKLLTLQEFEDEWVTDETAGFALRILNSWTKEWGENGTGVLTGSRAIPDGSIAARATIPSIN